MSGEGGGILRRMGGGSAASSTLRRGCGLQILMGIPSVLPELRFLPTSPAAQSPLPFSVSG
eukprot:5595715-Amphidinium_carterae.1